MFLRTEEDTIKYDPSKKIIKCPIQSIATDFFLPKVLQPIKVSFLKQFNDKSYFKLFSSNDTTLCL